MEIFNVLVYVYFAASRTYFKKNLITSKSNFKWKFQFSKDWNLSIFRNLKILRKFQNWGEACPVFLPEKSSAKTVIKYAKILIKNILVLTSLSWFLHFVLNIVPKIIVKVLAYKNLQFENICNLFQVTQVLISCRTPQC